MENKQQGFKLVIGLLIISIFFQAYSFIENNRMKDQLFHHQESYRFELQQLRDSMYLLQRQISELNEEEKWVLSKEFIPNTSDSKFDEIHLDFKWSFKKIENDATVSLLYRKPSELNWTKAKAQLAGGTTYIASLILSPNDQYEYQIVAEKDTIMADEIQTIPSRFYKQIPVTSYGSEFGSDSKGKLYSYSHLIIIPEPPLYDFQKLKEAYLEIYDGETLIDRTQFEFEGDSDFPEGEKLLRATFEQFEKQPTSIRLFVEYNNGVIHKGEVWPEENFFYNQDFEDWK